MDIVEVKKKLEKEPDKIAFLKEQLEKNPSLKSEIRPLLISEIKKRALIKTDVSKEDVHFKLIYDSVSEGLEPIYFWILDFMKGKYNGIGLDVSKTGDEYEASVGGAFFSEMGMKATRMQEQAMKMMQTINTIIRSLINLLYDLKEFEVRLETYKKSHSKNKDEVDAALLGLKQIWMDQVDIKRGRGSINMLAQQLQFVTLRDAFMIAKDEKLRDEGGHVMDLNERVKRILKPRIQEFLEWKNRSERELNQRFKIERSYVKSQLASLKLYTSWTKPYLKAAQKLGMKDFGSPEVVTAFSNMIMELVLFGKNSMGKINEKEYFSCVETTLKFRTVPGAARTQTGIHYIQQGRVEMQIRAYVLTNEDLEILKQQELYSGLDLIEEMVGTPLLELKEDIEYYLKQEKEEEKKEKKPEVISFVGGFREMVSPIGNAFKFMKSSFEAIKGAPSEPYKERELKKKAIQDAKLKSDLLYTIYKKAHRMFTW